MAASEQQDFNRSALTIRNNRVWYTGQQAEKVPYGLAGMVGANCTSLDLSYNNLVSVTALRDFVDLEELILDNNCLRDLKTLPAIPTLTTLSLNNNKISDVESALDKIRESCPVVRYVSLLGNPGYPDQLTDPTSNDDADYERYRKYAVHALPPSLRFLDSRPVTTRERVEARDRGRLLRTVRLKQPQDTVDDCAPSLPSNSLDTVLDSELYTPLPRTVRRPQDHRGAYGKCRYRYSGKNSEGNRFICNNDL